MISFHTSQRSVLPLASILGAHEVIGSYGLNKGLDDLLTQAIDNKGAHEVARRLFLVEAVGAVCMNPSLEMTTGRAEGQFAQQILEKMRPETYLPVIVLHPGAKDAFKQWPPSHFIALGRRLVESEGAVIFVTGGQHEKELVEEIASQIPGATPLISLNIGQLAALFQKVSLFVGNDTGPMHVAFSQNTPAIGLFAPTNPALCGPYGVSSGEVIAKSPTCSPCIKKRCQDPFCMMQIGVDEVYAKAREVLWRK